MLADEFFLVSVSLVVLQWALLSTEVLGQKKRGHVYTVCVCVPNAVLLMYVVGGVPLAAFIDHAPRAIELESRLRHYCRLDTHPAQPLYWEHVDSRHARHWEYVATAARLALPRPPAGVRASLTPAAENFLFAIFFSVHYS